MVQCSTCKHKNHARVQPRQPALTQVTRVRALEVHVLRVGGALASISPACAIFIVVLARPAASLLQRRQPLCGRVTCPAILLLLLRLPAAPCGVSMSCMRRVHIAHASLASQPHFCGTHHGCRWQHLRAVLVRSRLRSGRVPSRSSQRCGAVRKEAHREDETWIHLVADHFSPLTVGHEPCSDDGSSEPSGCSEKKSRASPLTALTASPASLAPPSSEYNPQQMTGMSA